MKTNYHFKTEQNRKIKLIYKNRLIDVMPAHNAYETRRSIAIWYKLYALHKHLGKFYFETFTPEHTKVVTFEQLQQIKQVI